MIRIDYKNVAANGDCSVLRASHLRNHAPVRHDHLLQGVYRAHLEAMTAIRVALSPPPPTSPFIYSLC
jgi:hypothetical protein